MSAANSSKIALRRRTVLAAVIATIGLAGASHAFAGPDIAELKVVDRSTGQPLRAWRHHGRLFVAGEPGERYSLRLTNHTSGRVLVVVSVDGINIITGETAGADQRGYVLSPHASYDITGWRKSETEVAAFAFAPLPQSYAAQTGRPVDVGVIGLAAFRELPTVQAPEPEDDIAGRWPAPPSPGPYARAATPIAAPPPPPPPPPAPAGPPPTVVSAYRAAPAPLAAADSSRAADQDFEQRREEKLGTAHGAREWSVSHTVPFVRATPYPQTVQQVEYDTYANLVASGVIPSWRQPEHRPRPFPSTPDGAGYVPDPPRLP